MNDKLKILLGSEDIVARNNEDLYLNINLNRSFSEYKKEKYDNDFNLSKQFDEERNLSRNFRVYGIIDSNIIDTSGVQIKVYSNSGATDMVYSTTTSSMNFNGNINVFNKKRGKYYIPLDNYSGSSIFIEFPTNNDNVATQIFEQKLIFSDFDGNFIPYGTETVEIDNLLNTIEIDNNFPFFYNKHWVKNNITIQETKYPFINFSGNNQNIFEGEVATIIVYLDKPSPFGNEKVDFVFDGGTAVASDFTVYLEGNPLQTFSDTFQLSFSIGEQVKNIKISGSSDSSVELLESYNFRLDNLIKLKSGTSLDYKIEIKNSTPRKYAYYEISGLFENRTPFLGSTAFTITNQTYATPSILRNGLYYNGLVNEFYPIDEFDLEIENLSNSTTVLFSGSNLGNAEETVWEAGETKVFNIKPQYNSSVLNEVAIYLPPSLNYVSSGNNINQLALVQSSLNQIVENISINGFKLDVPIGFYMSSIPSGQSSSYELLKKLLGSNPLNIYNSKNIFQPFTIQTNDQNYEIKLKSKSSGVRLDIDVNINKYPLSSGLPTVNLINDYSYPKQLPFVFKLLGNQNNGDVSNYKISFSKKSYKTLVINSNAAASINGQTNYLVTCLSNVLHNWDVPNDKPIAFSGNPIQANFLPSNYFLPKSNAYYQGLALLGTSQSLDMNTTNYGTSSNPVGFWTTTPISVIQKTAIDISNETVSQQTLLKINTLISATSNMPTTANTSFYSFKYRSGVSSDYTTFYWNGSGSANILTNVGGNLKVSGSTIAPRSSPGLKYEIDLGSTYAGQAIPVGPINVDYPGYNSYEINLTKFYSPYYPTTLINDNVNYQSNGVNEILLSAKSPGTPFEVIDLVNNNPNADLAIMPIVYNEINGVTPNPYSNKMGGFALTV